MTIRDIAVAFGLEGGGGSGGDGTHNVMSTTQLGEARTGKYLIMNKFAGAC